MKRFTILLVFLFAGVALFAQQPRWLQATARNMDYPKEQFLSAMGSASVRQGEALSDATNRAKKEAQVYLTESIKVMLANVSVKEDRQVQVDDDFAFVSLFASSTQTTTIADIAGMKVESYYDVSEKIVHAFAFVNRASLISYYQTQISQHIKKIEEAMANADKLVGQGLKIRAKKTCEKAVPILKKIEFAQDLLSAVDATADDQKLQLEKTSELRMALVQKMIDLEQSIFVFIKCKEDNMGTPSTILANNLKAIMAKNECVFTSDENEADVQIRILATSRKHDVENPDFKFAYVDVELNVFNPYKNKSVYQDEFGVKGGAMSYESATREAMKDAAKDIWEKIKIWVKNE